MVEQSAHTDGGNGGSGSGYSPGPRPAANGLQPGQNPGVSNLTQYGNPGYDPDDSGLTYYKFACGGSGNANNNYLENASFPNGSTIITEAPPDYKHKKSFQRWILFTTRSRWR